MSDLTLESPREMSGGWIAKRLVEFMMGYNRCYKDWLRLWKMMISEW